MLCFCLSSTISDDSCFVSWSQSKKPSEQWNKMLFRVYRNIGDDFRSIYVGIISYTIIRIASFNNQDSMESIRPGFLTVARPCQVFIETPDGSGNQLQGTPLGQRQLATSSRPSFYPKHGSQIIQDILKETRITSTVDNMIRWEFRYNLYKCVIVYKIVAHYNVCIWILSYMIMYISIYYTVT